MLATLVLLQIAPMIRKDDFDLARYKPSPPDCTTPSASEIIVCGGLPSASQRIDPAPATAEPLLPRAEIGLLGKSTMSVETEATSVGGFPSNRAMVRVKVPF